MSGFSTFKSFLFQVKRETILVELMIGFLILVFFFYVLLCTVLFYLFFFMYCFIIRKIISYQMYLATWQGTKHTVETEKYKM